MVNTYTYKITGLDHVEQTGHVVCVHFAINATNADGVEAEYHGLVGTIGEVSIPYSELTEEICLGWVKERLADCAEIEKYEEVQTVVTNEDGQEEPVTSQVPYSDAVRFEMAEGKIKTQLDKEIEAQIKPVRRIGKPW